VWGAIGLVSDRGLYHLEPYMLFSEWLFTPAGLEPVLKVRPLFREFLAQIGISICIRLRPQKTNSHATKGW